MRFYRLDLRHNYGESAGFKFFTTRRDAEKAFREHMRSGSDQEEWVCACENTEIEAIDIVPTKQGILAALKRHASHADNG